MQCTYDVTVRHIHVPIVAMEKQEVLHILSLCSLRYPACSAHVPCCHLWSAQSYNICLHYLINHKWTIFGEKFLNIECVFCFSLQLLCEIFIILRRTEQDTSKNVVWFSLEYPSFLSDFNETSVFLTDI